MRLLIIPFLFGFAVPAFADYNLDPVNSKYKYAKELSPGQSECVIKTMPSTRSQDALSICFAAAAATMIDEFQCYVNKNEKCTEVPNNERTSQLDMARFGQKKEDFNDAQDRYEYAGLKDGGGTYIALVNTSRTGGFMVSEECAPLNKALIGTKDTTDAQFELWKKFKSFHEKYRADKCPTCEVTMSGREAEEIKKNYQLNQPAEQVAKAMAQDTWEKALENLLIPEKCIDFLELISISSKLDYPNYFPPKEATTNPDALTAKAKEVVCNAKRPVGIDFCTKKDTKAGSTCKDLMHAVVIEGYREMCADKARTKCVPSFKVRNSWGESWQKANNDGWIDASTISKAGYNKGAALYWLEPRKTE
jgi:hypothetical protein